MDFSHYLVKYYLNKGLLKILSWKLRKKQMINNTKSFIHLLQHMLKVYMIVGSPINREKSIISDQISILVDIY